MNKLPKGAAEVLKEARRADRERGVDVERTLSALHASLPFADADLPPLSSEAGPSASAPAGLSRVSGKALFGGKAIKLFLATAVAGLIGGATLWGIGTNGRTARTGVGVGGADAPVAVAADEARVARVGEEGAVHAAVGAQGTSDENGDSSVVGTSGALSSPSRGAPPATRAARAARAEESGAARAAAAERKGSTRHARAKSAHVAQASLAATPGAAATPTPDVMRAPDPADAAQRARAEPASDPSRAAPAAPKPEPRAAAPESELDLIDAALTSLRDGQALRALSLLEAHRARYPAGKFTSERQGLRVLALCAAGRVQEGRAAREAFLRTVQDVPIVARVRRACEEGERER